MKAQKRPPIGAVLGIETWTRVGVRKSSYGARVRWTHPISHHREQAKASFVSPAARAVWLADLKRAAKSGVDAGQTLDAYVESLGDRWARTIDRTSTYDPYIAGLRRRVLPTLGHLPVGMLTAGLVDRAIDGWEREFGASTVKNTIAALVLVLDEAGHQCWGDMVTLLATTAMRFNEVSGLQVRDIDLAAGLIDVRRQTYPVAAAS